MKPLDKKEEHSAFKAKQMPNYKFFEPKTSEKKQIQFQEFNLKERSQTVMPEVPKKQFRAKPMPDFSRVSIMSLGPTCSAK